MVLRPGEVWNTAIVPFHAPMGVDESAPLALFSGKRLRFPPAPPIHTYADPFLFVRGNELYVFLEIQEVGRDGRIEAFVTSDLKRFGAVGSVFAPPYHVSYPQVFSHDGEVFMVPETVACGQLNLFRFNRFPYELSQVATLLVGEYFDATLLQTAGRWWIFATTANGLEIYHSKELTGPYQPHRQNPVRSDPATQRCGGPFLRTHEGAIFRTAQDGSRGYGNNLHLLRVNVLSEDEYEEEFAVRDLFECRQEWNRRGGHHLSTASFRGHELAAIDGKQTDYLANRLLSLLWRMR
jgi:hypothetical protein